MTGEVWAALRIISGSPLNLGQIYSFATLIILGKKTQSTFPISRLPRREKSLWAGRLRLRNRLNRSLHFLVGFGGGQPPLLFKKAFTADNIHNKAV